MSQTVYYQLSQRFWPQEGACIISDDNGKQLLALSISFLRLGHVNKVDFVLRQIRSAYHAPDQLWLLNEKMERMREDDTIFAGRFQVQVQSAERLTPRDGPRFKLKYRPPNALDDTASTMSNSKRSSANQSTFRMSVVARDFQCIVSDERYEGCTACHILPQSRPEYYTEVLGFDPGYLFEPSFGLLLRDDIHHGFDRGSIAFFPLERSGDTHLLVVHVLKPDLDSWRQYHGKILHCHTRFRGDIRDHPNIKLLNFHYSQSCIKYFRGWSKF